MIIQFAAANRQKVSKSLALQCKTRSSSSKLDKVSAPSSRDVCSALFIFLRSPVFVLPPAYLAQHKRVDFSSERTREKVEEERYMQSGAADLEGNRSWTINFQATPAEPRRVAGAKGNHPGVTFEHVDYNCDLCQRLRPFLSLSLSLLFLSLFPFSLFFSLLFLTLSFSLFFLLFVYILSSNTRFSPSFLSLLYFFCFFATVLARDYR